MTDLKKKLLTLPNNHDGFMALVEVVQLRMDKHLETAQRYADNYMKTDDKSVQAVGLRHLGRADECKDFLNEVLMNLIHVE